jgi:predicted transcriptional regulator
MSFQNECQWNIMNEWWPTQGTLLWNLRLFNNNEDSKSFLRGNKANKEGMYKRSETRMISSFSTGTLESIVIWKVTISWMRGERDKGEWWGMNSSMTYLIYCKNICKCHNVAYSAQK